MEPRATEVREGQNITEADPMFRSAVLGDACRQWHAGMALVSDLAQCRTRLRRLCPVTPGVYYWFDATGKLIYVGKAKSLRHRLEGYFQATPAEEKMRRIRELSTRLVWEETSHEFLALVREQEVIIEQRPTWNVQGQPKRQRFAFLCLSNHRAANLYVSFDETPNSHTYFGPILGSGRLREVAEVLNHHFMLRDCSERTPMEFGQQLLLFPIEREALCFRHEIGTCLGPCAAKVSADKYRDSVNQALAFLHGYDRSILQYHQQEMQQAARSQRFEKAASLRDRLRMLQWVDRRLDELRKTRYEYNCVYHLPVDGQRPWWALMVQGCVVAVIRQPQRAKERQASRRKIQAALEMAMAAGANLDAELGGHEKSNVSQRMTRKGWRLPKPRPEDSWGALRNRVPQLLMQSLTSRWFRRHTEQRENLFSYRQALESLNGDSSSIE
ncbi:MAG: UvrB/UvrC motif-containing protein [Planctomycetaceae bacterium]|nr:UvrB/UvrC motif-containing protein [Planctomycetaceae bacterium]